MLNLHVCRNSFNFITFGGHQVAWTTVSYMLYQLTIKSEEVLFGRGALYFLLFFIFLLFIFLMFATSHGRSLYIMLY